jgi:nitrite reductase/ring-hydroxylating ferredoxin subunit
MVCAVADMPENGARGFTLTGADKNQRIDIIIWLTRNGREDVLRGFVNKCPHMGLPLETFPDRFLSADGERLICSAHGAQFDFDGACFVGPCKGGHLYPLDLRIENRMIILPPQNPTPK